MASRPCVDHKVTVRLEDLLGQRVVGFDVVSLSHEQRQISASVHISVIRYEENCKAKFSLLKVCVQGLALKRRILAQLMLHGRCPYLRR